MQLKEIKETAFELLMNLHPQHIKILNNQILRPLYRIAEQSTDQTPVPPDLVDQIKHENIDLIERLKLTEDESFQTISALQDSYLTLLSNHEATLQELERTRSLLESKQKVIDGFLRGRTPAGH